MKQSKLSNIKEDFISKREPQKIFEQLSLKKQLFKKNAPLLWKQFATLLNSHLQELSK